MRLPDFMVIGAQKAGSTFVLRCLEEHPEIFMPRFEIPFFEDPDYDPDRLDKLDALLPATSDQRVFGIKRPNYLGQPCVPERIHRHMPDVKLITILRDPIERAVSAYFHYMRSGLIPVAPIEVGLPKVLDGNYTEQYAAASQIVEFGFYHQHLARYLQWFERDKLLILLYDQIKTDPDGMIRRAYDLLGVSGTYELRGAEKQRMAGMYSLGRLKLKQSVNHLTMHYYHNGTRMIRKRGLAAWAIRRLHGGMERFFLSRLSEAQRPILSDELHARLAEIYRADVDALRSLLNVEINGWLSRKA